MNWLDNYLAENETGYYVSSDGSYWVAWGDEQVRIAIGEGEPIRLAEISRSEFIARLMR